MSASGRQRLTRERVLRAALALVDREGPDGLTMRALGEELSIAAMSLYNHVAGRDELLDGLSELLVGEVGARAEEADPLEALRRFAHGIRSVALAHPHAFRLVGMRPLGTRASLLPVDAALGALRRVGLDDADAVRAYRALTSYARGFALAEISGFTLAAGGDEATEPPADGNLPHVAALLPALHEQAGGEAFEFGLAALLAGVRSAATDPGARRPRPARTRSVP